MGAYKPNRTPTHGKDEEVKFEPETLGADVPVRAIDPFNVIERRQVHTL